MTFCSQLVGGPIHNPWLVNPFIVGDNSYILTQPNGFLVDGRACSEDDNASYSQGVGGWKHGNNFVGATQAMGSMANHSPTAEENNAVFYLVTIDTEDYSKQVLDHVPTAYARPPITFDSRFIYAMALVSTRDIENEMVLADYRFDTLSTPEWYSDIHSQGMKNRQFKEDVKNIVDKTWEAGSSSF